jgi:uncharacterized coiled-coil DUF342 family protein
MSTHKTGAAKATSQAQRHTSTMGPFLIAAGVSLVIGVSAILTIPGTLSVSGLLNVAGLSRSLNQDDEITTSSVKRLVGEFATELEFLNERVEVVAKKSDAGLNHRVERIEDGLSNVRKTVDDVAINAEFLDLRVDRVARKAEDGEMLGLKKLIADLSVEVDSLNTRVETSKPAHDMSARFVELDSQIEMLRAEIAALKMNQVANTADGLAMARMDVAGLRSTLDEVATTTRKDISAITKRLDKLETIIESRGDVTASIGSVPAKPAAARIKRRAAGANWVVEASAEGIAVVKGRSGRFEVREGATLPGLGRVTGIVQQGGRWVVNTTRGQLPHAN